MLHHSLTHLVSLLNVISSFRMFSTASNVTTCTAVVAIDEVATPRTRVEIEPYALMHKVKRENRQRVSES